MTFALVPRAAVRRSATAAALVAAAVLSGACADRLTEPNLNSPSPGTAQSDPNYVQFAASGIIAQQRNNLDNFVRDVGIVGREAYNYTQTEGRNTSGYLINYADPTSFSAGSNWFGYYANLRNLYEFNAFVERAPSTVLSDAAKTGARGFSATMEGLELHYVLSTRFNLGAPVEIRADPLDLAPFVTRDSAYTYVVARLEAGAQALGQTGTTFPFTFPSGYTGFTTPATFLRFNRAITARVQAYRGSIGCGAPCYQAALTALGAAFVDPAGPLTTGVFATYSTSANDQVNAANTQGGAARVIVGHPSVANEFPTKPDGTPDNRYAAKFTVLRNSAGAVNPVAAPGQNIGIATSVGLNIYPSQGSSIPVIRNEELILLRAEARYFTGNVAGAVEDLNTIRTRSGGLAPITAAAVATRDAFVTELLLQRRFSLYLEGHRWVDVRRFGRLNTLPVDLPSHSVAEQLVVPQQECLSRDQLDVEPLPASCPPPRN